MADSDAASDDDDLPKKRIGIMVMRMIMRGRRRSTGGCPLHLLKFMVGLIVQEKMRSISLYGRFHYIGMAHCAI